MGHSHEHDLPDTQGARLFITMALNFVITAAEIAGGLVSGSLALVSDALHNFSDGISMVISYIAIRLRLRPNTYRHTFGLKRAEVFAAVINSAALLAVTIFLFIEAARRFAHPEPVRGVTMLIVASVGLAANITGSVLLHRGAKSSLNIKAAYLHLFTDAVSSVGVILGGIAISLWKIYWLDPLLTMLIGLYITKEVFEILKETVHTLMEGVPKELSVPEIGTAIEAVPGVTGVHHVHLWSVGENDTHFEAHIVAEDERLSSVDAVRARTARMLAERFGIGHVTLQMECGTCPDTGLIKSS
ncbi:MAG TPA: cation diffusion facilitator family transporter [Spirochaetia bacterium]|nr:cation diffusion facilitator family transporter [Spirochaetia bacterium]